jgi:hypothetical protein
MAKGKKNRRAGRKNNWSWKYETDRGAPRRKVVTEHLIPSRVEQAARTR